jgi:hypothetical protein
MTREELGSGYYKLNIPKTTEHRDPHGRVAEVFKRAFSVPAKDLVRSVSIERDSAVESSEAQSQ